jgi:hypothetical protein
MRRGGVEYLAYLASAAQNQKPELEPVLRGSEKQTFREAISSPALQHILMYHKRAYALVRDLRPTDSPEGHTYYTNPGRGRLLCHRLRRTTAYLDDLPIELESQSRPS